MVTCRDVHNEKNMATVAEPLLLTVEQYRQLPDRKDVVQELHWGQVVTVTRPKMRHSRIQYRLVE
jgi:Uma2 family endonuclease